MYFSVITPEDDLLRQGIYEQLKPPYAEHQWLWRFFPGEEAQTRDFVFRRHLDESPPRYYVVSHRPPAAGNSSWRVQSRSYDPQLQPGDQLAFRLCANPVVAKKDASGRAHRHDVVMDAKKNQADKAELRTYELVQSTCLAWLAARAKQNGFELTSAAVDAYQQHQAGKREIRFSTVDFSGELIVTDPDLFRRTLFKGLGRAKAFGCGLMLVKRIEGR
ncbi:type I-E CRISPR-associated protein Cas6/Cse3/CasE [Pseudoduganella namucuonensis]|nr:type I-E CRISPR-associated protein Cas6/Cse3/CasE [Pseudoduganella namucuonensis]